MKNEDQKAQIVITREFKAPIDIVFNAFSKAEALSQWWGPPGVPITVVKFDFKVDGMFHYKAEMNGQVMWGRFIYKQIRKPHLLEFVSSSSNPEGGIARFPFSDKFPLEILNRLEFTETNNNTTITLTGSPINATQEEMEAFAQMTAGMQQGFAGTFNQLESYLSNNK